MNINSGYFMNQVKAHGHWEKIRDDNVRVVPVRMIQTLLEDKAFQISKVPKTFEEAVDVVLGDLRELLISKQHDYGHKNITTTGIIGVIVRVNDKIARLMNLYGFVNETYRMKKGKHESILDTWVDLANYGIIAIMLIKGFFELELEEDRKSPRSGTNFIAQTNSITRSNSTLGLIKHP